MFVNLTPAVCKSNIITNSDLTYYLSSAMHLLKFRIQYISKSEKQDQLRVDTSTKEWHFIMDNQVLR